MKKIILTGLTVLLALTFIGCTTVTYSTHSGYVGFVSDDGVKTVKQEKNLSGEVLNSTYDDEFIYDEDGDLKQHIQTEYYNNGSDYITWEVYYQKINGVVLPLQVAVNGQVYMSMEYELMETDNEGLITPYTSSPSFYRHVSTPLLDSSSSKWTIDIERFDVPFKADGKYVIRKEKYNYYTGLSSDKVLSLGYDNIVLKSFTYSSSKRLKGIYEGEYPVSDRETSFTFEWDVVGGKLIQPQMTLKETATEEFMHFFVKREFDEQGRRISEQWTAKDSENNSEEEVMIFNQELTY